MASDWYAIKFLESATNVRDLIARSTGRTPSASVAREISVCLQQGRLFFEAAEAAPIQIRPLQIYYGVVAFARAVVVAKRSASLATLAQSHGLSDVTPAGKGVEDLTLRFEGAGTFQEFSDTIAPLGRVYYFDKSMPRWFENPFDLSATLKGQLVTIKDVLSRIPDLSKNYRQTFGCVANTLPIMLDFNRPTESSCTLRMDDPDLFMNREDLIASVQKWRKAYPFLNSWRFREASHAWGYAILVFDNGEKEGADDLSQLSETSRNEFACVRNTSETHRFLPLPDILPALSGGYVRTSATSVMQPLLGTKLPEYSLQVLGTFLLGSLVRYRPQVWQNAISRSVTANSAADDRSLSLIEKFLDVVLASFPELVARIVDYERTT